MYISEIRQVDPAGKPVSVSPDMLVRVRQADEALRDQLQPHEKFAYAAEWLFPASDKAVLNLQVQVPNEPEPFRVNMASDPVLARDPEWFASRAIRAVLTQASKEIQKKLDADIHRLLTSSGEV